ncbi:MULTISPECIES: DUF3549 family protein [Halomonadaceae]|uniref:DUF3549 family protein n=1 Tax=Halomonadaceae TaxID=28256 RepID=UPI001599502A|nr:MULTISPECIES: DUF3549 family protein [Halomonas]QJQ95292.1 DUF3549 family protein [Halomonas sp. PA5]
MQPIATLHDFFTRSGAELRLYHMGRRVVPFDMATLCQFEAGELSWPAPWRQQARIACVFTLGDSEEPMIWFLALSLDEQGMLCPASRDAFIQRLLETLGRTITTLGERGPMVDNLMKDNPLAFTPSLTLQAMLHAYASRDLERPASQHLELAEEYLTGEHTLDWQALGLQGLADFAVRHDREQAVRLANQLDSLPSAALHSLCYCLEHVTIDDALAEALRQRGENAAAQGDVESLCACVRAMGGACERIAGPWFTELLEDSAACGPDLLAAMAARGWEHLEDEQRLPRFLLRLAEQPNADFAALARDLAQIPRLRLPVLMYLRNAEAASPIGRRLAHLASSA